MSYKSKLDIDKKSSLKSIIEKYEIENKRPLLIVGTGGVSLEDFDVLSDTRTILDLLKGDVMSSQFEWKLELLSKISKQADIRKELLEGNNTLEEILMNNNSFKSLIKDDPKIKSIIHDFSDLLKYVSNNANISNPELGVNSKKNADIFAEGMTSMLKKVKKEGFETTRSIADRFNELGVKSARGGDWSHNTVARLIRRRKELGLEENDAPENG